jgi:hypothetical protein
MSAPLTDEEIRRLQIGKHLDAWSSSEDCQRPDGNYDTWLRERMLATIVDLRIRLAMHQMD